MRTLLLLPILCVLVQAQQLDRKLDWWETTVFYQIYPRSFMDSNGDGIGDLNGITSKLEYLRELGIGATWLSPIFQSSTYDFGNDIADFYAIHNEYGTMKDFENLIMMANRLDMRIVLDLAPNHSSNESEWFLKALQDDYKYHNYFVWEHGVIGRNGTLEPPNNWISLFGKSAWKYRPEVGKYYLHQFAIGQPDLNYRNPNVVKEMKNVIRFWLDKGVAGFRMKAVNHLFEVDTNQHGGKYPDEPLSGDIMSGPDDYDYLDHIYTKNLEETYDMVYQWKEVFNEYKAKDGLRRVLMTEVFASPSLVAKYFGDGDHQGADIPYNFVLISKIDASSSAHDIKYAVDEYLTYKPVNKLANWAIGNHDMSRVASRYGLDLVDGMNMMVLLHPGVGITYMGEEIGMVDGYVSWEDTVDFVGCNTGDPVNYVLASRDPERTPFQWNAENNAGFSTAEKTWLPVADGYETLNVEAQKDDEKSHLNIYKALIQLRAEPAFRHGRFESVALNNDVYAFRRWYSNEIYLVLVNFRKTSYTVDLTYFENVTKDVEVNITSKQSPKSAGEMLRAEAVPIVGLESFVLKVLSLQ